MKYTNKIKKNISPLNWRFIWIITIILNISCAKKPEIIIQFEKKIGFTLPRDIKIKKVDLYNGEFDFNEDIEKLFIKKIHDSKLFDKEYTFDLKMAEILSSQDSNGKLSKGFWCRNLNGYSFLKYDNNKRTLILYRLEIDTIKNSGKLMLMEGD